MESKLRELHKKIGKRFERRNRWRPYDWSDKMMIRDMFTIAKDLGCLDNSAMQELLEEAIHLECAYLEQDFPNGFFKRPRLTSKITTALTSLEHTYSQECSQIISSLDVVTSDQRCLCAYKAVFRSSTLPVYAVLWDRSEPGSITVCQGLPVVYVDATHSNTAVNGVGTDIAEWDKSHLLSVQRVIEKHKAALMKTHSTLNSIEAIFEGGGFVIQFGVPCKGFIPVVDQRPSTVVRSSWHRSSSVVV